MEQLNEEFKPLDTKPVPPGEPLTAPVEYPTEPAETDEYPASNVLDPETEARVKANHERYMKAAPVPGQLSADALEAQGFTVRRVGE